MTPIERKHIRKKVYYLENKEKIAEYKKMYWLKNKEKIIESRRNKDLENNEEVNKEPILFICSRCGDSINYILNKCSC